MVRRSAAGRQGLLGYDRPELHVQSGTVVTDPEARDCVISGRADCRIRGGFGGGTTLSQQPCPGNQSTKLSNEPHDLFCMRKKDFSVGRSRPSGRLFLAVPRQVMSSCNLLNGKAGHDVDFALGVDSRPTTYLHDDEECACASSHPSCFS